MDADPEELVDLCQVRSPFEADTIAACLQDRGFRACAMTLAACTVQWEGGITNTPRVQVPRSELTDARAVLAAVKEQAKSIDWEQELENYQAGAVGAICVYCGASRTESAPSESCPVCGKSPPPLQPQLNEAEVGRMRLRSRHLLYFGLFLIVLPTLAVFLLTILDRILRR